MNQVHETIKPFCDAICPPADSPTGKIETKEYDMYAQHMRIIQFAKELEAENGELKRLAGRLLGFLSDGVELKCVTPRVRGDMEELKGILRGTTQPEVNK